MSLSGSLRHLMGAALLGLCALGHAADEHAAHRGKPAVLAPGYGALSYSLPVAGTYALPVLGQAADGPVLDATGRGVPLFDLLDGRYSFLAFMYTRCPDVNGCPLSSHVFNQIKTVLQDDAELAKTVQLISLSFDPGHDTPEVMQRYAQAFRYAGNKGDWHFLTTASESQLAPLLSAYGQDRQADYSLNGSAGVDYAHSLRVFLIDPERQIRNIYSVSYLHRDVLLADVRTLQSGAENSTAHSQSAPIAQPGDDKRGYESGSYQTSSRALLQRQGQDQSLLTRAKNNYLGLPKLPAEQIPTQAQVALGRSLFFDRRLSLNNTISCAMCHIPEQGFTSNELRTPVGFEGRSTRRNAPSLFNVGLNQKLFHDGRDQHLEEQIWAPLLARNEMANPSVGYILEKIRNLADYDGAFEQAFDRPVSMETLGAALAAYQRVLLSADSPFDRWYYGADKLAVSEEVKSGFALFTGKARCASCHHVAANSALFTDHQRHNTGVGYANSFEKVGEKQKVQVAPGLFVEVDSALIARVGNKRPADYGYYEITQQPEDRWKYKTPSLRNVALSAPYMHDGSLSTLHDVVQFYNRGGVAHPQLSQLIQPLNLNTQEVQDLVAFLQSLTGSNVNLIVEDAFSEKIGDTGIASVPSP